MVYKRGDYGISVEQIDGFGKKPGLWVHKNNQAFKMASFGSFNKAELFMKYLDYFMFDGKEPDFEIVGVSEIEVKPLLTVKGFVCGRCGHLLLNDIEHGKMPDKCDVCGALVEGLA